MGTIKIAQQGPSGRLVEDAVSGSPNFGNTSTGSNSEKCLFLERQKEILLVRKLSLPKLWDGFTSGHHMDTIELL